MPRTPPLDRMTPPSVAHEHSPLVSASSLPLPVPGARVLAPPSQVDAPRGVPRGVGGGRPGRGVPCSPGPTGRGHPRGEGSAAEPAAVPVCAMPPAVGDGGGCMERRGPPLRFEFAKSRPRLSGAELGPRTGRTTVGDQGPRRPPPKVISKTLMAENWDEAYENAQFWGRSGNMSQRGPSLGQWATKSGVVSCTMTGCYAFRSPS